MTVHEAAAMALGIEATLDALTSRGVIQQYDYGFDLSNQVFDVRIIPQHKLDWVNTEIALTI